MDRDIDDLSRLADQAALGLLRIDGEFLVAHANDMAHHLLAKRPGGLVGHSVMEAFLDHRVEELMTDPTEASTLEIDGPAARRLLVRVRLDQAGPPGCWTLLEDVTELRRLQRIRTEFIDNLSHELRTPLTTIRLLTERLADELLTLDVPSRVRDRVATIDVETGHLVQMVNELLDLSRIEQATTTLHLEDVAVAPLLEAAIARMRTFADRSSVDLELDVPADVPPLRGDPGRLAQLLLNLVHNAVKFSPDGHRVTLAARQEGDMVVLAVTDEGIGIARADQARIFERFYKVDRARDRGQGGTGLGLAIARHIAEAHGGSLGVESEEGKGATFLVSLPVSVSGDGRSAAPARAG